MFLIACGRVTVNPDKEVGGQCVRSTRPWGPEPRPWRIPRNPCCGFGYVNEAWKWELGSRARACRVDGRFVFSEDETPLRVSSCAVAHVCVYWLIRLTFANDKRPSFPGPQRAS